MSGQGFRYLMGMPGFVLLCIGTLVLVVTAFKTNWRDLRPPLLVGAFVALAALSFLWSATRLVTAIAVLALVLTTSVAMVTARGSSSSDFMFRLYRGLQISLVMGIVFELVVASLFLEEVTPVVSDLAALAGEGSGVKP